MKRTNNVKYYLAVFVAFMTLMVYLTALQNDFVNWDDNIYVYENVHIRSLGPDFFKWAFFDFYAANWHPLTWMSHALDYALWGMNPLGHHLTSIILHAINTFLVVLLAVRLLTSGKETGKSGAPEFVKERRTLFAAGLTGLLFGLHPLHVESVAWVSERKDLLCALFFLLSISLYAAYAGTVNGREDNKQTASRFFNSHYLGSFGFFVLALLSKPMAVTLPVVLLILDWQPFKRIRSLKTFTAACVEKLPFMALSSAASVITILAQRSGGALQSTELAPLSARLLVAATSLVAYLRKLLWPVDLLPFYQYPKDLSLWSATSISAIALLLAITAACILAAKKHGSWLSAWGYYVMTLLPVLGILQVGGQSMADRYAYLPSIGPLLAAGSAAGWGSARIQEKGGPRLSFLYRAVVLMVLIPLSYLTVQQIGIWKNGYVLWNYVIEKDPGIPRAYNNRGIIYKKMGLLNNAIEDYNRAIALDPFCYEAYYNRGRAVSAMGRPDQAIEDYGRAIAVNPSYVEAYNYRGMAFDDLGRPDKAIEDYDRAIALDRSYYKAYHNKGTLFGKTGMPDKAIAAFNDSLAIAPDDADAYYGRGVVYASIGRNDSALEDFNKAILLNQDDAAVYLSRGRLYLRDGNKERAWADFRSACYRGNNDGCNELH